MKIKFWGVRGSIPSPSPQTVKIGGNTTCIEVEVEDKILVFDAGTGMRYLGLDLMTRVEKYHNEINIFFTHFHWDHIQGFPFFVPAFIKKNKINIFGSEKLNDRLEVVLKGQMESPFFPIKLEQMGAQITFHELIKYELQMNNIVVKVIKLNHPNESFGYKVIDNDKIIVIATDFEHFKDEQLNSNFVNEIKNADILVYDSQYTPEEYENKQGWGHSTYKSGVEMSLKANVKNLILTHHDPSHTDEKIFEIEKLAQQMVRNSNSSLKVMAAYEGLAMEI